MIEIDMSQEEYDNLAKEHGPNYAAWEFYGRWLKAWGAANPDDERNAYELVDVLEADQRGEPIPEKGA
jgi:hypothetical protein